MRIMTPPSSQELNIFSQNLALNSRVTIRGTVLELTQI